MPGQRPQASSTAGQLMSMGCLCMHSCQGQACVACLSGDYHNDHMLPDGGRDGISELAVGTCEAAAHTGPLSDHMLWAGHEPLGVQCTLCIPWCDHANASCWSTSKHELPIVCHGCANCSGIPACEQGHSQPPVMCLQSQLET